MSPILTLRALCECIGIDPDKHAVRKLTINADCQEATAEVAINLQDEITVKKFWISLTPPEKLISEIT